MSITGDRLRDRRKFLGLSADEVAADLGVSRSTIFRYENGYIEKVPANIIEELANILSTTPAYLMGWSDDPTDWESVAADNGISPPHDFEGDPIDYIKYKVMHEQQDSVIDGFYDALDSAIEYLKNQGCQVIESSANGDIDITFKGDKTYHVTEEDLVSGYLLFINGNENFSSVKPNIENAEESRLLTSFRKLNDTGKEKAIDYVEDLGDNPKYSAATATPPAPEYDHLTVIAAHNDHATEPGQLELMRQDAEMIKKMAAEKRKK